MALRAPHSVEEIEKDKVNASFRYGVLTMALCNSARAQPADVTPCVPSRPSEP